MPKSIQLQKAGQHGLVAAVRHMGGFRTIAAHLHLRPSASDKRGRPKKIKWEETCPVSCPEGNKLHVPQSDAQPAAASASQCDGRFTVLQQQMH